MKLLVLTLMGAAAGTLVLALGLASGPAAAAREKVVVPLDGKSWSRNLDVHPGSVVTVKIVNRTGMGHTFYVPALHVNKWIEAGTRAHPSVTTVTFSVPHSGVFEWHCLIPCGEHMGGVIFAPAGLDFTPGWTVAA